MRLKGQERDPYDPDLTPRVRGCEPTRQHHHARRRSGRDPVGLVADGRIRRWYSTDSYRALMLEGGSDTRRYEVGISPSLFRFVSAASAGADEAALVIDADQGCVGIAGAGGQPFVTDMGYSFPDIGSMTPTVDEPYSVSAPDLGGHHAGRARESGRSEFDLRAEKAIGGVRIDVNARLLQSLVELFAPGDEIEVRITRFSGRP